MATPPSDVRKRPSNRRSGLISVIQVYERAERQSKVYKKPKYQAMRASGRKKITANDRTSG